LETSSLFGPFDRRRYVIVLPMRKAARVVVLFFLGLLSSVFVGVAMALMSAVSLAATALIVPGTGTPDANMVSDYRENAADRFIAPFSDPTCTSTNGCTLTGINYPASFFPLVIFPRWCVPGRCETWNTSVEQGVDGVVGALSDLTDPQGATLFGYSQGGAVVSNALRRLEGDPLLDKVNSVVMIGNAYNPDGGLFTRLGFLPTIPFLNITFGPATPVDTGIPMTSIGFEYDPVMYAPLYWGNPLAMLNAFAAFDNVHGFYLTPNGNGPTDPIAYGYTEDELSEILAGPCPGPNCRVDSFGNDYYMIPAKSLPIMDLLMSVVPSPLTPVVKPIVDLVSPTLKVLIDLGYDWSGDPGVTRTLSILPFNPFQNWAEVGFRLVAAAGEGVQAFLGDLGVGPTVAPPAPAPVLPDSTAFSTLAEESGDALDSDTPVVDSEFESEQTAPPSALKLVQDETVVDEGTLDEDGATVVDETVIVDGTAPDEDETVIEEDGATIEGEDETTAKDDEPAVKDHETEGESPAHEKATDVKATETTSSTTNETPATKPDETKDEPKADDEQKADDDNDADNEKAAA
jgi:pimeloyl-ACP methyl ester carboxylesterase